MKHNRKVIRKHLKRLDELAKASERKRREKEMRFERRKSSGDEVKYRFAIQHELSRVSRYYGKPAKKPFNTAINDSL